MKGLQKYSNGVIVLSGDGVHLLEVDKVHGGAMALWMLAERSSGAFPVVFMLLSSGRERSACLANVRAFSTVGAVAVEFVDDASEEVGTLLHLGRWEYSSHCPLV